MSWNAAPRRRPSSRRHDADPPRARRPAPIAAPLRILFFGSGAFGVPTLEALRAAHRLVGVVTQPDRPAGRGAALTPTPVSAYAEAALPGVPVWKPERVSDPAATAELRRVEADAWVVIAFGQKLPPPLLADRFAINLHGSILPRWRGAAPIHAAILAGDAEAGNTVITLADRMDAGLVLGLSRRPLTPELTAGDLHDLLAGDGPALVLDVLSRHAAGTLVGQPQDESRVTRAGKLRKEDGWADFSGPAEQVRRRVHGLNPWPVVTANFRGQPLRLLRVGVETGSGDPGAIIDPAAGIVACGAGTAVRLIEVQPAGKRLMNWRDFAAGARPALGERITCAVPGAGAGVNPC